MSLSGIWQLSYATRRLTLWASLSAWPNLALAYGPCDEDVQKLCKGEFHQETEKTCLHKKVDQLSPECKSFVKGKEEDWKKTLASWDKVKVSCSKDIDQQCADVKAQADEVIKPMQVCLMMVSEKLSVDCKKSINRHIKDFQPQIKELE